MSKMSTKIFDQKCRQKIQNFIEIFIKHFQNCHRNFDQDFQHFQKKKIFRKTIFCLDFFLFWKKMSRKHIFFLKKIHVHSEFSQDSENRT